MKLKFFVILLLSGTVCLAQDRVVFDYDKSGNMTKRYVEYSQQSSAGDFVFELKRVSSSGDFTLAVYDKNGNNWLGNGNVKVVNVLTTTICYDKAFKIDASTGVASLDWKFLSSGVYGVVVEIHNGSELISNDKLKFEK